MPRNPSPIPTRLPSPSDQLAELVRQSGRSPAAIAAAAQVAPSVLSRFLRGESGISSGTFDRIALALGGLRLALVGARRARPRPELLADVDDAQVVLEPEDLGPGTGA